jgi:aryl-alcohol dehydrogenase-like predicted oxidoreductase
VLLCHLTPTKRDLPLSGMAEMLSRTETLFSGDIGFGCMGITAFYGAPMEEAAATELLASVYELGYRHFDTAEIYKTGNPFSDDDGGEFNEVVCGKFFATVPRESFTVATKIHPGKHKGKTDYATVKAALLKSLARLKLDYVDLYYCHRIPSKSGALEFMASCKRLVEEGLIRHVGLSEICGAWLREAHAVHPVAAVEQEWSLLTRGAVESELAPVCAELGVTIVAYSPLARNMLCAPTVADVSADWRAQLPRFMPENAAANAALMVEVGACAAAHGCTAAQLSLAWLLARAAQLGVRCFPIPGTTKQAHAAENVAGAKVTLTETELALLETFAARVAGERAYASYVSAAIEGQLL